MPYILYLPAFIFKHLTNPRYLNYDNNFSTLKFRDAAAKTGEEDLGPRLSRVRSRAHHPAITACEQPAG